MAGETSKTRKSRIELDYYKKSTSRASWKAWLGLSAFAATVGWIGLAPRWSGSTRIELFQWNGMGNPGKLAAAHSLWDQQCDTCHQPFQSLRWNGENLSASPSDARCSGCHAGAPHHPSQREDGPACVACHKDHAGRESTLVSGDDRLCTVCHRALDSHLKSTDTALDVAGRITGFDASAESHPEFRPVSTAGAGDPGTIAFNHARHLVAGMPTEGGGGPIFTFGQLPERDRTRYGWTEGISLNQPVQLDCKACHILDNSDLASALGLPVGSLAELPTPRGEGGALMLPIRYEAHCKACHPLRFDPDAPAMEVPHGLQPGEVLSRIKQIYAEQAIRETPELLNRPASTPAVPGRSVEDQQQMLSHVISDEILTATRILFGSSGPSVVDRGGCLLCHKLVPDAPSVDDPDRVEALAQCRVEGSIPSLWFTRARFDHTSHRGLECASCHTDVEQSTSQSQVLLPGKESCLPCHLSGKRDSTAGGSCTVCHSYHGGANPWHGRGAFTESARVDRDVRAFLNPVGKTLPGDSGYRED